MNARQIEVYGFYKAMHPEALILYRLPGQYMILGEDVQRASKSIPTIQIIDTDVAVIPDDISVLSSLDTELQIISYRNDEGVLDLPDIHRLRAEKEMDY